MNAGINKYLNDPNFKQPTGLAFEPEQRRKQAFQPLIQFGEQKISPSEYDNFTADIIAVTERHRATNKETDEKNMSFNVFMLLKSN